MKRLLLCLVPFAAVAICTASTPTVTGFFGFSWPTTGADPSAPVVQASDGNLYGTTARGGGGWGNLNAGTVFKITLTGQFTLLHTFGCYTTAAALGGCYPGARLVEGNDGFLYGTTSLGGTTGRGIVFKISKTGQFQKLHDFCQQTGCADGDEPSGDLVFGLDGNLYGSTNASENLGTFFRISPTGTYIKLTTFPICAPAAIAVGTSCIGSMISTGLVLASDGNFYGLSARAIFRAAPSGRVTAIYVFNNNSGSAYRPNGSLIQAKDGRLYGVTNFGGAHNSGYIYRISLSGAFQSIYDLPGNGQGSIPNTLLQASDGNLWGTTRFDVPSGGSGWVYSITTAGSLLSSVHLGNAVGSLPVAPLIQATNGKFYGTASSGGIVPGGWGGSIFAVNAGLSAPKPSVTESVVEPSTAGSVVTIHGSHFVGATAVSVDGVRTDFEVQSDGAIKAALPPGATAHRIEVFGADGSSSAEKELDQVQPE